MTLDISMESAFADDMMEEVITNVDRVSDLESDQFTIALHQFSATTTGPSESNETSRLNYPFMRLYDTAVLSQIDGRDSLPAKFANMLSSQRVGSRYTFVGALQISEGYTTEEKTDLLRTYRPPQKSHLQERSLKSGERVPARKENPAGERKIRNKSLTSTLQAPFKRRRRQHAWANKGNLNLDLWFILISPGSAKQTASAL
ncbi:hypothetical protein DFQ30_011202 [Apophysomyces sp. BC1015]|nr:hypothetical protein DFQ30_011202 [Apophysomyces sp. BC1015]